MIKLIKKWRERRRVAEYQRGYEFAAGVLLKKGEQPGIILDLECRADSPFGDRTVFDEGVLSAIKDYERLVKK